MKWIHIVAGLVSIVAGFAALYATKGGRFHRRAGLAFVAAMLTMTSSAVLIAATTRPNVGNVIAGCLTFYLVATSMLTVRAVPHQRGLDVGLMVAAGVVSAVAFAYASAAAQRPSGAIDGIPAAPLYLFSFVAMLGFAGDVRRSMRGALQGARRIARHLWRMTFALWIATASLFLGQPRFFPDFLRQSPGLRAIPVLIVLVALFYWLAKTLRRRRASPPVRALAASQVEG